MNLTSFLKLKKPLSNEKYDIAIVNENADRIDSQLQKLSEDSATKEELKRHTAGCENPHQVTARQIGLDRLTNDRQIRGLASGTAAGHAVAWGSDGYTVTDSGFTLAKSVPADAKFTDSIYTLEEGIADGTVLFNNSPVNVHGLKSGAYHDHIDIGDEQPLFTVPSVLEALVSGERLAQSFGKTARAVQAVIEAQDQVKTQKITLADRAELVFNAEADSLDLHFL